MGEEAAATAAQPTSEPLQAAETPGSSATGVPERPDFDTVLSQMDSYLEENPEYRHKLRSHRVVAGIAGDIAERNRVEREQEAARTAVQQAHDEMRELADRDPEAFAKRWLNADEVDTIRRREAGVRDITRREFAGKIGAALQDLPEFKELTDTDVSTLSTKLRGVAEDEVVGTFVRLATDMVSDKRAQKLSAASLAAHVAEQKKVWEAEQRTKRLKDRVAPSVTPPSQGSATDTGEPADFYSPEWQRWDNDQRKRGLGVYASQRLRRTGS